MVRFVAPLFTGIKETAARARLAIIFRSAAAARTERCCSLAVRPVLLAIFTAVSALSPARASAHPALYTITPRQNQADGILFHITSETLPEGKVRFHFVLTENQAKFNRHPLTELGLVRDPLNAHSVSATRKLAALRQGGTLTCVFEVDQKALANPDFCFLYSNLDSAFDEKILFALSRNFVFVRLRDFRPPPH